MNLEVPTVEVTVHLVDHIILTSRVRVEAIDHCDGVPIRADALLTSILRWRRMAAVRTICWISIISTALIAWLTRILDFNREAE